MKSKSDFWLTLHKLASDLQREGDDNHHRAESVCEVLNAVSPGTKSVYLDNLDFVLAGLADVAAECKGGGSVSRPADAS